MKQNTLLNLVMIFLIITLAGACHNGNRKIRIGKTQGNIHVLAVKDNESRWGIQITDGKWFTLNQPQPVSLEIYRDSSKIERLSFAYDEFIPGDPVSTGTCAFQSGSVSFVATDTWSMKNDILEFSRIINLTGSDSGGFMSSIAFLSQNPVARENIDLFVPGMIYGKPGNITNVAIGGTAVYENGNGQVWIREDRMPAPLYGVYFPDGISLTLLNPAPTAITTAAESRIVDLTTMTDERFSFGAPGTTCHNDTLIIGYQFPGSEGEYTYTGNTYPSGQLHGWRKRYHPLSPEINHAYTVHFRFAQDKEFTDYFPNAWRWAWNTLKPEVNHQDIETMRKSIHSMLYGMIEDYDDRSGISIYTGSAKTDPHERAPQAVMGFVGKNLEAANYLLMGSRFVSAEQSALVKFKAYRIIDSFVKLKMDPPDGEGFILKTGEPVMAFDPNAMFLRSFGDDMKAMLKAVMREGPGSYNYDEYIVWLRSFADWLLKQQSPSGGFPRKFKALTGEIVDSTYQSSYTVVPFLALLTKATGDSAYHKAAVKAMNMCWENWQQYGHFIGGTIDNPNVLDKEAGTLSLEAYLLLYQETNDPVWLERARLAADFSETWIYIWDVPMPADANDDELHWKKGISTVGLQLISTGHSLVDAYMAFDADEYAILYDLTKDEHYEEVAAILLHNTKAMVAIPGREFDLRGPGWQQEHWSLAPVRGNGLHRGWLPWVSTSQLNGIYGIMEYDQELYQKIINIK